MTERTFPIQTQRGAAPHPLRIPWSLAELAYSQYAALYGQGQTLERLAERGGFGPGEMDSFLPGWRERCSELATLAAQLAAAQREIETLTRDWEKCDEERERYSDALIEAHRALGGDGEWVAKPGSTCAPGETGDLAIDVPALAEQALAAARGDALEAAQNAADAEARSLVGKPDSLGLIRDLCAVVGWLDDYRSRALRPQPEQPSAERGGV